MQGKKEKSKRIGVLMGGVSEEREISLLTGKAVVSALRSAGFSPVPIDAGRNVAQRLRKERIEVAFIALHGRWGEDGCIQGLLEIMGIPYTGSGVRASSLAMDKLAAKEVFAYNGIPTPKFCVANGKAGSILPLAYPVIVKPLSQGSAIGVRVARRSAELQGAIRAALKFGPRALVEKFIEGRELTVSILDQTVLPVIEIIPKGREYFDFKAKYVKGKTSFLVPAPLGKATERRVKELALKAYNALSCRGAARVDMMLGSGGRPYVLEVNTVPGLTERSLFPKAAEAARIDYRTLVVKMLEGASLGKF